jgi:hypothetical protein
MESRTTLHTSAVKMTSIKIGIKPNLRLMTIFWIDNQKMGFWKDLAHQL